MGIGSFHIGPNKKHKRAGNLARDRREWAEAALSYRQYLRSAPADAAIWVQLGHALKENDDLLEAEEAYQRAAALMPRDTDVRRHLGHLLKRLDRVPEAAAVFREAIEIAPTAEFIEELARLGYGSEASTLLETAPLAAAGPGRFLELKDLFQYLNLHTTVTGITRVVLGLIKYVLEDLSETEASKYYFVHQFGDAEGLRLLSKPKLARLLTLVTAEVADHPAVLELVLDMRRTAPLVQLKTGDLYFMPGAFWEFVGNPGWLLSMKRNGIYIGTYVYDLIPISHTHFCMSQLTDAFNMAFSETARLYDFTLTISEFGAKQVRDFVSANGIAPFPAIPVTLAHELHFESSSSAVKQPTKADTSSSHAKALTAEIDRLINRPFVLCVCTIEARKNHIYLFYIWQQMIDDGIDVPDLVFVGRHGWRVHDLLSQIESSRNLDGRLHVVHGLSDTQLASLYEHCLFTVFPSFVEGWGLPVGESLAYGKVCVASQTTSIPEVGREFAVYIDPFNLNSGYETIRNLIANPARLQELEANIKTNFVPRTWKDVGGDFFREIDRALETLPPPVAPRQAFAPYLKAGMMLGMPWLLDAGLRRSDYIKNPIRLILAQGWQDIERNGTWIRHRLAKLRFHADYQEGREISILMLMSTSPWVTDENTLKIWASERPVQSNDQDNPFLYFRSTAKSARFWIRLKGHIEENNIVTIQFQLDGPHLFTNPIGAVPLGIRLHSVGYAATDDFENRIGLVDEAEAQLQMTER